MIHHLKIWPVQFEAVREKRKTHEVRRNDRDFHERDLLFLEEWDPVRQGYTGQSLLRAVTFVTPGGAWGLPEEICVLSIR